MVQSTGIHSISMATNVAFSEETEPSAMHRPSGSGFGAEEGYEEQSSLERRENLRSSGSRGSSGARGRQTRYTDRYQAES